MSKRNLIAIVCWFIAFVIALSLDSTVAAFVHSSGLGKNVEGTRWAEIIKLPGWFLFTAIIAGLLWLFRGCGWKASVFVILAGAASGINAAIKWIVGRVRPYKLSGDGQLHPFEFHPFFHGIYGLFHQHDLCFPSGHATSAFALAAAVAIAWPRGSWIFFPLAVLVGIERIAENAHYCSDVVAAAGLAILCVSFLNYWLCSWMKAPKKTGFPIQVSPMPAESGILRP